MYNPSGRKCGMWVVWQAICLPCRACCRGDLLAEEEATWVPPMTSMKGRSCWQWQKPADAPMHGEHEGEEASSSRTPPRASRRTHPCIESMREREGDGLPLS